MSLSRVRLLEKVDAAEDTMSFHFEKPAGFGYKAGQFADYTLLDPPETDDEGSIRGLLLSSAPYWPFLMATTRLRDTAFKRVLRGLPSARSSSSTHPTGPSLGTTMSRSPRSSSPEASESLPCAASCSSRLTTRRTLRSSSPTPTGDRRMPSSSMS